MASFSSVYTLYPHHNDLVIIIKRVSEERNMSIKLYFEIIIILLWTSLVVIAPPLMFFFKKNSWKQNLFGAVSSFCSFCLVFGICCSGERLHLYLDILPDNSSLSCNGRLHRGYRCHPKTHINVSKVYSLWKLGHGNIKSGQKKKYSENILQRIVLVK